MIKLNFFRSIPLRDDFLLVNDYGDYTTVSKKEFLRLKNFEEKNFSKEDVELLEKLEENNFIITKKNSSKIIKSCKDRYKHLDKGTSLHIIAVTKRCNLNCEYCHSINDNESDLAEETAKDIVDFVFQSPAETVMIEFQGGEPLLNFDIIEYIVNLATKVNFKYSKNLKFSMTTNLLLMDELRLRFCQENKIKLMVSFDGIAEVHDKNRSKSHSAVVDKIKWVRKEVHWILDAIMVVTKHSLPYHKEIIDEYIKLGFGRIWIQPVNNIGSATEHWKDIGVSSEEFFDFWKKSLDYILDKNLKIEEVTSTNMLRNILNKACSNFLCLQSPCGAAIGQMAYDHEGNIYTCDEARIAEEDFFLLGNVKKHTYNQIMKSRGVKSIVSLSTNDTLICDSCVWKPFCGVCVVRNYIQEKDPVVVNPRDTRCKLLKKQWEYLFTRMLSDDKIKEKFEVWIKPKTL